jgi:hypothetical protein
LPVHIHSSSPAFLILEVWYIKGGHLSDYVGFVADVAPTSGPTIDHGCMFLEEIAGKVLLMRRVILGHLNPSFYFLDIVD